MDSTCEEGWNINHLSTFQVPPTLDVLGAFKLPRRILEVWKGNPTNVTCHPRQASIQRACNDWNEYHDKHQSAYLSIVV